MTDNAKSEVLVIGAGVLGLSTAAALARRGVKVAVLDAGEGRNASAAAAGMIAPAFEAALEDATSDRAALYRAGRDLWPDLAARLGLRLDRTGADWIGPREPLMARMAALGFAAETRDGGFHTVEDWLIDPVEALTRLQAYVVENGGALVTGRATRIGTAADGVEVESTAGLWRARAVVLAWGWRGGAIAAPGLEAAVAQVTPIKGQIIELEGVGVDAVVRPTRAPGVYLVPRGGRLVVGATMQAMEGDLRIEDEVVERLRAAAVAAIPALAEARVFSARAGVRGAASDGLPIVGPGTQPDLFCALAPRRNGWLLGPLIGQAAAGWVLGDDPGAWAGALRPDRFVS